MLTRQHTEQGVTSRGPTVDDIDFEVDISRVDTVLDSGGTSQETVGDAVVSRNTEATIEHEYQVEAVAVTAGALANLTYESLDPGVASIDAGGRTTRVADGVARFLAKTPLATKRVDGDHTRSVGAVQDVFVAWADGSLAKHCCGQIDSRIAGKTMAANGYIYTTQDHVNQIYVRNPDLWCSDVDLTCISPWNDSFGTVYAYRTVDDGDSNTLIFSGVDYSAEFPAGRYVRHPVDGFWHRIASVEYAADTVVEMETSAAATWAGQSVRSFGGMSSGIYRAGVAVTPRHVLIAEHFPISAGHWVRFIAADNTVVDRQVAAIQNVGEPNASDRYATDIRVLCLSADLPASITPCKVMPAGNIEDYFPSLTEKYTSPPPANEFMVTEGAPVLCLDQEEKALVRCLKYRRPVIAQTVGWELNFPLCLQCGTFPEGQTQRLEFSEEMVDKDSGNPAFLIVNGELVLLLTTTSYGPTGPDIALLRDQVQAAMDSAATEAGCTQHQLQTVDLGDFTNYGGE